MGTNSAKKFLKQSSGQLVEEYALSTSAGAADANRIPALNASGVLDSTIVNSTTTSAGAASAGKVPALNASGTLDLTMMPSGVGTETILLVASEALAAGDIVNIWSNAGTANVRKADASTTGKEAHGFVLAAVAAAASATVYREGANAQASGLTVGVQYLSAATPGKTVSTAPTTSGGIVQRVGVATSATSISFLPETPIGLA